MSQMSQGSLHICLHILSSEILFSSCSSLHHEARGQGFSIGLKGHWAEVWMLSSWRTVTLLITAPCWSKSHLVWRSLIQKSDWLQLFRAFWYDAEVIWRSLIGYWHYYGGLWLEVEYLKGLCGVFGLTDRQVGSEQWKNNCSIYKGPFNRRGSSVSLTGTQTVSLSSCYHELTLYKFIETLYSYWAGTKSKLLSSKPLCFYCV